MDPKAELLHLGRQLHILIRQCGTSVRAVSVSLGFHSQQLTRVLNGRRPMPVKLVFAILQQLHVFPHEFFNLLYPLGGVPEALLRQEMSSVPRPPGFEVTGEQLRRLELERGGPMSGEEAAEKLRLILRREIAAKRITQRSIARSMGRGEDTLGHALRGDSELTFLHVFATLAATGRTPGRIFAELVTPTADSPVAQMAIGRALDVLEELHSRIAAGWTATAPSKAGTGEVEGGAGGAAPAKKLPGKKSPKPKTGERSPGREAPKPKARNGSATRRRQT